MTTTPFEFTKHFIKERCESCGRCLNECPVLQLPIEQAQAEIRALVRGEDSEVLTSCTGCMACNRICPNNANPHTLIVSRWRERYEKEGIPVRASLVLPYQQPNLYTLLSDKLPEDEKTLVRQWEENGKHPPKCDTMIYAGCNILLQPFLLDSKLFKDIPIFGSTRICCGEPLYRMGCWDAERVVAQHLREEFSRMGFKKLIVPCLAGYHMFKHVYPEVFDVTLDFDVISIEEWLLDRIRNGSIEIAPLGKTAVIHDNCWPKASGEKCFETTRTLLNCLGISVIEPAHTREQALCCGMCAGASRFALTDILHVAKDRLREFDAVEADMAIDYCGGCHWLFSLVRKFSVSKRIKPEYHILEVVQMAAGETSKHRTDARTRQIVSTMAGRLIAAYTTRRRIWIDAIEGRPVEPGSESL